MQTQTFTNAGSNYQLTIKAGTYTVHRRGGEPLMTMTQDYAILDYTGAKLGQAKVTKAEVKLLTFEFDIEMEAMLMGDNTQATLALFVQAVFEQVAYQQGL